MQFVVGLFHWIKISCLVEQAALVFSELDGSDEIHRLCWWCFTGSRFPVRWYRQLWFIVNLQVPMRCTVYVVGISLDGVFVCGGIINCGVLSIYKFQWDTQFTLCLQCLARSSCRKRKYQQLDYIFNPLVLVRSTKDGVNVSLGQAWLCGGIINFVVLFISRLPRDVFLRSRWIEPSMWWCYQLRRVVNLKVPMRYLPHSMPPIVLSHWIYFRE